MKKDSLRIRRKYKGTLDGKPLSGLLRVKDFTGKRKYKQWTCSISFDQKEMDRIGKEMPRGLSMQDPAFLEVEIYENMYAVFCVYFAAEEREAVLLYKTENRPEWLRVNRNQMMRVRKCQQ